MKKPVWWLNGHICKHLANTDTLTVLAEEEEEEEEEEDDDDDDDDDDDADFNS